MDDECSSVFTRVFSEDVAAARKALENHDPNDPRYDALVTFFAARHARIGPRQFAVAIGKQIARHSWEKTAADMRSTRISVEESRKQYEQIRREPISEKLLDALAEDLEDSVIHYDRLLMQSRAAYVAYCRNQRFRSETDQASYHAREAVRPTSLLKEHVIEFGQFAADCRARKGMPTISLGKFSAFTAIQLVFSVTDRASGLWFECVDRQKKAGNILGQEDIAAWNFVTRYVPHLPASQELMALLGQECSLMRVMLQDHGMPQFLADPPPPDESGFSTASPVDAPPSGPGTKAPVLRNWAFGYDATSKTWWLFHRKEKRWDQRQKVRLPTGLGTRLMVELADGNGKIDKSRFVASLKISSSDRSLPELGRSVDQAMSRLRKGLKSAIAAASRCNESDIGDPIPLLNGCYVAEAEIGWAEPDEKQSGKMLFRLQDEY